MAEPSTALGRQAAFAANFLGTTNLAQRRRYQEDIAAAEMQDEALMEQQFQGVNRLAELADPLRARQTRIAEQKLVQDATQFDRQEGRMERALTADEKAYELRLRQHQWQEEQKGLELDEAKIVLNDTVALRKAYASMVKRGLRPGTDSFVNEAMDYVDKFANADPKLIGDIFAKTRIEGSPEDVLAQRAMLREKGVNARFRMTSGPNGVTATLTEMAQEQADPRKLRRDLEKDLNSINDRLLRADPAMKPYWAKRIKETEAELLKLDSGGQQQPAGSSVPTAQGQAEAPKDPVIPKAGEIRNGYKFKGGKPGDPANWSKVE